MEDRDYLDARFNGLEKLIEVQNKNLTDHISAVSRNVKSLDDDLSNHKESSTAHGIEAVHKSASAIVSWLGFGIAAVLGAFKLFEGNNR